MISTDPISDMLTRIRNAIMVGQAEVVLPYSKLKHAVAGLLAEEGYLAKVSQNDDQHLTITIAAETEPVRITQIDRMSKPGRRLYAAAKDIPRVKNGRGLVVVSTSKGLMSGSKARQEHLGGELICKVY